MRTEAAAQVSLVSGMEMHDIDELLMDLLLAARKLSRLVMAQFSLGVIVTIFKLFVEFCDSYPYFITFG